MKTIARNRTKKIAEIAAAATSVVRYDQSSGNMVPSTVAAALAALTDFTFSKLRDRENGTYVVEVHSNLWYEIDTRPQAAPEPAEKPATDVERDTRVEVTLTRKAIGTQLAEALDTLGVAYTTGYAGGAGYYEVNGTSYTAGALADLVLEGGFDGAYGRSETVVRQDSPLKPGQGDALMEPMEEIERTPVSAGGSVTLPSPVDPGDAATLSVGLTRAERRALRGGVTKRAARPALDGLRRRSLVTGGDSPVAPVRLTAMGRAVVALLKGAPVPA